MYFFWTAQENLNRIQLGDPWHKSYDNKGLEVSFQCMFICPLYFFYFAEWVYHANQKSLSKCLLWLYWLFILLYLLACLNRGVAYIHCFIWVVNTVHFHMAKIYFTVMFKFSVVFYLTFIVTWPNNQGSWEIFLFFNLFFFFFLFFCITIRINCDMAI